ncbi:hypothetical protein [Kitasatospora mediocidica]|uniref:hypothetical protein n=1 Tax=Kitasatospora mediocidica TaxID=58352 RepID=UPI0012F77AA0|nr:hypothetical protein [Kitasatospora mediocidica]
MSDVDMADLGALLAVAAVVFVEQVWPGLCAWWARARGLVRRAVATVWRVALRRPAPDPLFVLLMTDEEVGRLKVVHTAEAVLASAAARLRDPA